MSPKISASFLILALIIVLPLANAQSGSLEEVKQESVQITIDLEGNLNVAHQISDAKEPRQLKFINGTVSNLKFTDQFGKEKVIEFKKELDSIMILPDQGELTVQYDLEDALVLENNVWRLDFRYLQTTIFIVPEELEILLANNLPVYLDEKKGFVCHGCQVSLEYSINEPKNIKQVNWEDEKFFVEVKTFAEIESFDFNQSSKKISFKVNDNNQFVTTVIPLELLWDPYMVFLDNEKIFFYNYMNNGTHVWLNMKPESAGEITIIGTTVIPEFPIIAPLAIGFSMILVIPLIRKFNLH